MLEIEIGRELDGRWIAEAPSLPGALAYGVTEAEAEAGVLAKAAVRAATILDISPVALGKILGLSKSGQARLAAGAFELAPTGGPFVRATLFVRTFALLDTMTGGDEEAARSWLCAHNNVLRDTPLDVMQTPRGLARLCQYLEARLSRV